MLFLIAAGVLVWVFSKELERFADDVREED